MVNSFISKPPKRGKNIDEFISNLFNKFITEKLRLIFQNTFPLSLGHLIKFIIVQEVVTGL
jgi:hypothetical protein